MSVSEDSSPVTPAPAPVADPAPLGLAAFALTTFLLSASNAGWMSKATTFSWLGYALAYGGLAQLLAGMWEFRNRNVFGATAFGSYGGFWIGLALWFLIVVRNKPIAALAAPTVSNLNHDIAWILLAWAIFNTYMLISAMQVNAAVFMVFLTLEATEIILLIGNFQSSQLAPTTTIKIGGYLGVVTAAVAWYTSWAGVLNGLHGGRQILPVGKPFFQRALTASRAH
jgi:succinate-acetate transporter protein